MRTCELLWAYGEPEVETILFDSSFSSATARNMTKDSERLTIETRVVRWGMSTSQK